MNVKDFYSITSISDAKVFLEFMLNRPQNHRPSGRLKAKPRQMIMWLDMYINKPPLMNYNKLMQYINNGRCPVIFPTFFIQSRKQYNTVLKCLYNNEHYWYYIDTKDKKRHYKKEILKKIKILSQYEDQCGSIVWKPDYIKHEQYQMMI